MKCAIIVYYSKFSLAWLLITVAILLWLKAKKTTGWNVEILVTINDWNNNNHLQHDASCCYPTFDIFILDIFYHRSVKHEAQGPESSRQTP